MENIFSKKNCFKEFENVKSILMYGDATSIPNPVVSILMPVYKRPDTFAESLNSTLNQDFNQPYEIVVVDNFDGAGKSPNLEVVERCRAKNIMYYHNESNLGLFGNWNRCVELARSEYVTFCHDDDLLLPTCLTRLMELQKKYGKKCILSSFNLIDEKGNMINQYKYPHRKKKVFREKSEYNYSLYNQFIASRGFGVGCLFNRNCMLEIGGYNNEYYPSADYALHACYTYYFGCLANNIPTFNYRVANNVSLTVYDKFAEVDRAFRLFMIPKLKFPKFLLKVIVDANYRTSKRRFAIKWGKVDESKLPKDKIADRIIMKIARLSNDYKGFLFSFG